MVVVTKYRIVWDFLAQNRDIIQDWFKLYQSIRAEYGIFDKDTYKMDENRYMMGIAGSSKVVFLKYQKPAFINQAENREWASLIECNWYYRSMVAIIYHLKKQKMER